MRAIRILVYGDQPVLRCEDAPETVLLSSHVMISVRTSKDSDLDGNNPLSGVGVYWNARTPR